MARSNLANESRTRTAHFTRSVRHRHASNADWARRRRTRSAMASDLRREPTHLTIAARQAFTHRLVTDVSARLTNMRSTLTLNTSRVRTSSTCVRHAWSADLAATRHRRLNIRDAWSFVRSHTNFAYVSTARSTLLSSASLRQRLKGVRRYRRCTCCSHRTLSVRVWDAASWNARAAADAIRCQSRNNLAKRTVRLAPSWTATFTVTAASFRHRRSRPSDDAAHSCRHARNWVSLARTRALNRCVRARVSSVRTLATFSHSPALVRHHSRHACIARRLVPRSR